MTKIGVLNETNSGLQADFWLHWHTFSARREFLHVAGIIFLPWWATWCVYIIESALGSVCSRCNQQWSTSGTSITGFFFCFSSSLASALWIALIMKRIIYTTDVCQLFCPTICQWNKYLLRTVLCTGRLMHFLMCNVLKHISRNVLSLWSVNSVTTFLGILSKQMLKTTYKCNTFYILSIPTC